MAPSSSRAETPPPAPSCTPAARASSPLIGNAVARDQIHLDDTLDKLGIDDNPPSLTPAEKQATVQMLSKPVAASTTAPPTKPRAWKPSAPSAARTLPAPWFYNNWDFNALRKYLLRHRRPRHRDRRIYRHAGLPRQRWLPLRPRPGLALSRLHHAHVRPRLRPLRPALPPRRQLKPTSRSSPPPAPPNPPPPTPTPSPAATATCGGQATPLTPSHHPEYVFPKGSFWLEGHLGQYAVVVRVDSDRTKGECPTNGKWRSWCGSSSTRPIARRAQISLLCPLYCLSDLSFPPESASSCCCF